jgi:hypothetical protein
LVVQELAFNGHDLIFSVFEKEGSASRYEVDFLITNGKKISPVEVRSGVSGKHASLDRFIEKYHGRIGESFVVHSKDLRTDGKIAYLPIYMTMFL